MEAFEELYCRVSALELLVFAMAKQLDAGTFAKDFAAQKQLLFNTATFSELSDEVTGRMTSLVDRYTRLLLGSKALKEY